MRACIATLALVVGCAGSPPPEVGVDGSVRYGPIDGFTQIPRAGGAGTTDSHQPTFHELGIKDATVFDVQGRVGVGDNALVGGYATLSPEGTATIDEPLETQGFTFPAGSTLKTSDQFDVYDVAYERSLHLNGPIVLAPRFGYAFFRVADQIEGPGATASRGYSRGNFALGIRAELALDESLSLEARAYATPSIPNVPTIYSGEGRVSWHPLGWLGAFVGLAGARYEYSDTERPLHNDVRVILGPLVMAGIEARY